MDWTDILVFAAVFIGGLMSGGALLPSLAAGGASLLARRAVPSSTPALPTLGVPTPAELFAKVLSEMIAKLHVTTPPTPPPGPTLLPDDVSTQVSALVRAELVKLATPVATVPTGG